MTRNACNNENGKSGEISSKVWRKFKDVQRGPLKGDEWRKWQIGKNDKFGENLKVFKGASWKVVILTKMANLAKMTNSPVWSHRHVYLFGQNRHYWREPFEHIIRSSVSSLTNFAEFTTFQGAPLLSHLAYSYGVDEFLLCSPFSPNSAHSSKSPLSMGLFDLSFEYIV